MAGEAGDGGGSPKQPPQVAGKGKEPLSPTRDTVPVAELTEESPEENTAPVLEDDQDKNIVAEENAVAEDHKGKMAMAEENAVLEDEKDKNIVAEQKTATDLQGVDLPGKVSSALASFPPPTAEGKRGADGSAGGSAPKQPRQGTGSPAKMGKELGSYVVPVVPSGTGVLANVGASSILSDPAFVADAAASGMEHGFASLTGMPMFVPQAGSGQLCSLCRRRVAVTNVYSRIPHVCLCVECVELATREPMQVPCQICRQEAINTWNKYN